MLKKLVILCLALAVAACGAACAAPGGGRGEGPGEGRPALTVGGAVVTVADVAPILDRALQSELGSMPAGLDTAERRARLEARVDGVISALVDEQLVLAEAGRLGLAVAEDEVAGRVEDLKATFPEVYEAVAARVGLETYAEKLRLHLLYEKAKERIIAEEAKACAAGARPGDDELLEKWLARARTRTSVRVFYRPDLAAYLKGATSQAKPPVSAPNVVTAIYCP